MEKNMSLLVVGAGGYGHLAREIAELIGYKKIDYLDDNSADAVGRIDELEIIEDGYDGSIVAIGNPEIRKKVFKRLKKPVNLIHPTAVVSRSSVIGVGCIMEANSVINSEAVIKDGTFICAGAVVNHNSTVGAFVQIDCNAVVAMGAEVPDGTKVNSCTVFSEIIANVI